jgi:hypothetical protein
MPSVRSISLRGPIGGIRRRFALQNQEPFTTVDARNVWGSDYSTDNSGGRDRISTRPGITATGATIGIPYNWTWGAWTDSGAKQGVFVACDNGLWRSVDGATWVELIEDAAGSDFSSCTVLNSVAYFARYSDTCLFRNAGTTAGAGTPLSNAGGGTQPTNCGLVSHYQDRLVLAGDEAATNAVYFGGTGDPTEWNYADTSLGDSIPVAFSVDEPPSALIAHTRDCFLIASTGAIWAQRGNPATGELEKISHYVGIVSHAAWTHDGTGNLWFLSHDGMYRMQAGCGDFSQSISRESLPDDFVTVNLATSGTYASLSYDPRFRCLWLFVDRTGSDNDIFWSFDLQNGAWFTHTFSAGPLRLGATLKTASTSAKSALLAIAADGDVFQFDRASSESFDAYVWYGPIQLGGPMLEGILHSVQATVAAGSDDVSWEVYVAGSAEEAFALGTPSFTGADWTVAGLNSIQHPRRRGAFAFLKVESTGTARWSIENIDCTLHSAGIRRIP